jgi:hypothetical protein
MKPYSEYTAEELAMERLFIRWVQYPDDSPIRLFWEGWMKQHPDRAETVASARELVGMASEWEAEPLMPAETDTLWGRIWNSIEALPELEKLEPSLKAIATNWYFLRWSVGILASVVLIVILFLWEPGGMSLLPQETTVAQPDSVRIPAARDSTRNSSVLKLK